MKKYYKERFEAQKNLSKKLADTLEVNDILEKMREEARKLVPSAMEVCVLLLDPDAPKYTRPLQCALYNRPVNCLSCKRNRAAVIRAQTRKKGVVIPKSEPIVRQDGSMVETGPEAAIPVFVNDELLAVLSVVSGPGMQFTKKDFYLIRDLSEMAGNFILNAKKHWEITQEKIQISQMLAHLSPFVPQSVRQIVEDRPEMLRQEKEKLDVTVLFLDLEGYTRLSADHSDTEVNEVVEKIFSSFVDPIHRSGGDINETAGDGLMILFKGHDAKTNAIDAVRAALDIGERSRKIQQGANGDFPVLNVNMGINSGLALVGMTKFKGSLDTRMTFTASGPVTNLAARLADYAKGGEILIGEDTKELINHVWPVFDKGEVDLKGINNPVHTYVLNH